MAFSQRSIMLEGFHLWFDEQLDEATEERRRQLIGSHTYAHASHEGNATGMHILRILEKFGIKKEILGIIYWTWDVERDV